MCLIPENLDQLPDVRSLERATVIADLEPPAVRLVVRDDAGRDRTLLVSDATTHLAIVDPENQYDEILALGRAATAGEVITAHACYTTGYRRGAAHGRAAAQREIQRAIGLP